MKVDACISARTNVPSFVPDEYFGARKMQKMHRIDGREHAALRKCAKAMRGERYIRITLYERVSRYHSTNRFRFISPSKKTATTGPATDTRAARDEYVLILSVLVQVAHATPFSFHAESTTAYT